MGLDIYVGTLTRYYAREWETVIQRYCREQGIPLRMERHTESDDRISDPATIEAAVVEWRLSLSAALGQHDVPGLAWAEGLDPPYFTDKPAWDCYGALLLWAAHDEHPHHPKPAVALDDWRTDPAYLASTADGFQSRYDQLLADVELWLPASFDFTFVSEDVAGQRVGMGSVPALYEQLDDLNRRTWCADQRQLTAWRQEGADQGASFEQAAHFGFAVVHALVREAAAHTLPMKLDY